MKKEKLCMKMKKNKKMLELGGDYVISGHHLKTSNLFLFMFLKNYTALYCISGGLYCIVLYFWRIILHRIVFLEDYTALYCISGG